MGEPETKHHRVESVRRPPVEKVSVDEVNVARMIDLALGDRQRLARSIDCCHVVGDVRDLTGEIARPSGELEHVAGRIKPNERLSERLSFFLPPSSELVVSFISPGTEPPVVVL